MHHLTLGLFLGERNILESLLGTVEQHVSVQGVSRDVFIFLFLKTILWYRLKNLYPN